MRKKSVLIGMAILVMIFLLSSPALAKGPWSIFGEARPVKEGIKPNPWAIELSSMCPNDSPNCLADNTLTYSGVTFRAPNKKMTFSDLVTLSTAYKIKEGDCGGGSPRFSIGIDTDGDGKVNGHVFVYIGPTPSFAGCPFETWENTGNLIGSTEARFEISQLVPQYPTLYMDYDEAQKALGDIAKKPVIYVMLVADSGWLSTQTLLVDNVKVNNFKLTAKGFSKKDKKK